MRKKCALLFEMIEGGKRVLDILESSRRGGKRVLYKSKGSRKRGKRVLEIFKGPKTLLGSKTLFPLTRMLEFKLCEKNVSNK